MGDFTYTWEYSNNGRGGWTAFDDDADTPNNNQTGIPESVEGKFVRLVVTFKDANDVDERVASTDPFRVGEIVTLPDADIPTINAGGQREAPVGRTLRIKDLDKAKPEGGSVKAEWLADKVPVHTGETFTVTSKEAGKIISLRLTSYDKDGYVTSIVTSPAGNDITVPSDSATDSAPDRQCDNPHHRSGRRAREGRRARKPVSHSGHGESLRRRGKRSSPTALRSPPTVPASGTTGTTKPE